MAMQTGVSTSKALILVGAGLTGSVILRSGRLSDVIAQLQEVVKGVNEVEFSSGRYDSVILASQIRQLAQEIKELTLSRPVTILNGNSDSSGNIGSYLVPAAALGAMGYCYMWWKGWSFSDVMFVTKKNMANAVANVSKQLEQLSGALASTKRHLSQRLENLDGKLDEQKEVSKLIMNEVNEVTSNLSQIGFDLDTIYKMVSGLFMRLFISVFSIVQDITNSGLWYLCQIAGDTKNGLNANGFQDISGKLPPGRSVMSIEDKSLKGLQFITEPNESGDVENSNISKIIQNDSTDKPAKMGSAAKTRIHRRYPIGISLSTEMLGK
ncbi:Protein of unknown function DUF1664 [Macleaya cordata]|uniref:DUF1664 domain-containing protein n=1 Tax=Macleaya cordata TaxID=56857 RepID=A0A200RBG3_MACCD|nr:Protein of unknown function DUF1664 [Macleaya cordata]